MAKAKKAIQISCPHPKGVGQQKNTPASNLRSHRCCAAPKCTKRTRVRRNDASFIFYSLAPKKIPFIIADLKISVIIQRHSRFTIDDSRKSLASQTLHRVCQSGLNRLETHCYHGYRYGHNAGCNKHPHGYVYGVGKLLQPFAHSKPC